MIKTESLVGKVFGSWSVIDRHEPINGNAAWLCRCACGIERAIRGYALKDGRSKSCGCVSAIEIGKKNAVNSRRHGHAVDGKLSHEYMAWMAMKSRCNNPSNRNYKNYGARGICVCERWERYENFLADAGPRPSAAHSLERKDVNKGYSPDNVCWATKTEQARNKRTTRKVQCQGRFVSLSEAAEITGIEYVLLASRWARGIRDEAGMFAVVQKNKSRRCDRLGDLVGIA